MFREVRRQRRSTAMILGAVGVIMALTAIGAGGAQAEPGNSENAKKCQKGGWTNYVRSDGTAFASGGECTSYAAKGGQLEPKPTARTAQQICEDAGGTFETGGTEEGVVPLSWRCLTSSGRFSDDTFQALKEACFAEGSPGFGRINPNSSQYPPGLTDGVHCFA